MNPIISSPPAKTNYHLNESLSTYSPQALIKEFLKANLPDFPTLSGLDISIEGIETIDEISSPFSQSINLSLPDSFDLPLFGNNVAETNEKLTTNDSSKYPPCPRCGVIKQTFKQQLTEVQQELSEARRQSRDLSNRMPVLEAELAQAKRLAGMTQEGLSLEVRTLEDRCARLTALLDDETSRRTASEARAVRCEKAEVENNALQKQVSELRSLLEVHSRRSERDAQKEVKELDSERMRELLQADKLHLQNEVQLLQDRLEAATRQADAEKSKCISLETRVGQLTDQCLTLQLSARSGFDERMQREVERLREESHKENELLKKTTQEIIDRENRVLREGKASLESEVQQLRRRTDTLLQELIAAQNDATAAQRDAQREVSELRTELRLKSFELTSLGTAFEERMSQLRQSELENERISNELTAHRSALARVESERDQLQRESQRDIDELRLKLHAYEALEVEIDQAVMRAAARDSGSGSGIRSTRSTREGHEIPEEEGGEDGVLHLVRGIPSNPERRVRQAVFLAQRLLETERQRDEVSQQLKEAKEAQHAMQRQVHEVEKNLARAAQPATYLVNKLREEEKARLQLSEQAARLQQESQRWRSACVAAERESDQLRERLQMVLQQRGELETVKAMLRHLHRLEAENNESSSSDDDIEEEEEEEEDDHSRGRERGREGVRGREEAQGKEEEEAQQEMHEDEPESIPQRPPKTITTESFLADPSFVGDWLALQHYSAMPVSEPDPEMQIIPIACKRLGD